MEFKKIQLLHKKLQKEIKTNKTLTNKVFIRHWNVFYNQLRNRDISLIEQKSNTILYNYFLKEIGDLLGESIDSLELDYSSNNQNYRWIKNNSSLFNFLEKEVSNE